MKKGQKFNSSEVSDDILKIKQCPENFGQRTIVA